jgi:DNA modification methylase
VTYYKDDSLALHHGDCIEVMRGMSEASVDAIVTDPPYGLEFMGKAWDAPWKQSGDVVMNPASLGGYQDGNGGNGYTRSRIRLGLDDMPAFQTWCNEWATEALRVLKPGGHMLAFGGTRTWHRLACAIEDAGFEIRDNIAWMYGSGFPKSLDVSKAINKAQGALRERVRVSQSTAGSGIYAQDEWTKANAGTRLVDDPITADAVRWQGWGTALKPAFEPIVVARKPLIGTVAGNVLAYGTGALNVDGCRIGTSETLGRAKGGWGNAAVGADNYGNFNSLGVTVEGGRWPANVILNESQALTLGDESRFFYTAKASTHERPRVDGTGHPTVKPLDLMRYLVRLVTPPGGIVLEPFAGSGTTLEACIVEGFTCIGIERDPSYLDLIVQRVSKPIQVTLL